LKNYLRFPRNHRLITKAEFKYVFDKASKINQKHFLILFRPNQKQHARIGIIVGKRFVNSAVTRNQIRRVIRDSFRLNQKNLSGWDIVVITRLQCDTLSKEKIREGINSLWKKLLMQHPNFSLS